MRPCKFLQITIFRSNLNESALLIGRQKTIGVFSQRAGEDEMQPRLFGGGTPVDVEDVLLEMVRPAEVFAAEGAGEGIPGT